VYQLLFTKNAEKSLRRMPRDVGQRIRQKLEAIKADPYAQHNNVKKLQNRPGYRLRVGDWRIIYEIKDQELLIIVIRVGVRGDIYR
jgi:mRNA interferase RelE/StbE